MDSEEPYNEERDYDPPGVRRHGCTGTRLYHRIRYYRYCSLARIGAVSRVSYTLYIVCVIARIIVEVVLSVVTLLLTVAITLQCVFVTLTLIFYLLLSYIAF